MFEVFSKMQAQDIPKAQARQLVANCFRDLVNQTDACIQLDPSEPDEDRAEQRGLSQDEVSSLRRQRATGSYAGSVISTANLALASMGLSPDHISPSSQSDLYDGIARAFLERERLFQFRLDDRLASFQPTDPLFSEAAEPARVGRSHGNHRGNLAGVSARPAFGLEQALGSCGDLLCRNAALACLAEMAH